jgi:uncharacterized protein (TIGR03435 family)
MRYTALAIIAAFAILSAQSPSGPTFDVVSIKKHVREPGPAGLSSNVSQRPDGGLTMTNVPVTTLIARAYAGFRPADYVGLPDWARSEYFDVSATSTLTQVTADDRAAMMRTMLGDRFKFVAHIEKRSQEVYDLLVSRSDGKLGAGLTPIDTDCAPVIAAQREAFLLGSTPPGPPQRPDLNAPPPPCTLRSVRGRNDPSDRLEGEATMAALAEFFWMSAGRPVVDKTGLPGSYRVKMNFDLFGSRRGPEVVPPPDAAPTVFTAVREQLGLKLDAARAELDALIIDRLERPTEN